MRKVELSYALHRQRTGGSDTAALLRNPMMDVLHAVRSSGSMSLRQVPSFCTTKGRVRL